MDYIYNMMQSTLGLVIILSLPIFIVLVLLVYGEDVLRSIGNTLRRLFIVQKKDETQEYLDSIKPNKKQNNI